LGLRLSPRIFYDARFHSERHFEIRYQLVVDIFAGHEHTRSSRRRTLIYANHSELYCDFCVILSPAHCPQRGRDRGHLVGRQHNATPVDDLLAPVYRWFTEGFDTLDLKQARCCSMSCLDFASPIQSEHGRINSS
jgi:hypothetical protein